jgi:hypothetical protein
MGVPAEQIAAARPAPTEPTPDEDACPVWAWHVDAVRLLRAMRTQWRTSFEYGRRRYLGLDYAALREVRAGLGLRMTAELLAQLQTLEIAGARALNEAGDD